ncbi:MAG: phosphoribosylformylglycinamidine cyclo-ligase [candidate division Zixibacteria bacterium]|nr:phosphoribosylformylglycinamidine cyclo-ligase [candidate division Zixibacteria bacterium]
MFNLTLPLNRGNLPLIMEKGKKLDYAAAGVSLKAADQVVEKIKTQARSTFNANVLSDIGLFGGLFRVPTGEFKEPVLVASTDSVGTKVKLGFMSGIHNTVGQDIVNHCVNDILVQGARPLFFLDYVGIGKLIPEVMADIVAGLAKACRENGAALLGGETAELPGFYKEGEYDLVGTIVGIVEREKIINGSAIAAGDVVIGLPSVGLHTNGYSLARKICFDLAGLSFHDRVDDIGNEIGLELMTVHKSYLNPVSALLSEMQPSGMAHITGSGIPGNLIRIIPQKFKAVIRRGSWPGLPIFDFLQKTGSVADTDMYDAFNMGIGYIIVVRSDSAGRAIEILAAHGQPGYKIGIIETGARAVEII